MKKIFDNAVKTIAVLLLGIAALLLLRPVFWRIFDKPTDRTKTYMDYAERGKIYDRKGKVLATNKTVADLHIDCCVVENQDIWEIKSRALAQELAHMLPEKTTPEWWDYLQNARNNRRRYLPIVKNAELSLVDSLSRLPLLVEGKYSGGRICTYRQVRVYPHGDLARRTVGDERGVGEGRFLFGIERAFDGDLNGDDGFHKARVGYRGGKRRQWQEEKQDRIDGWDVHMTLDLDFQNAADSILRAAVEGNEDIVGGCIGLMEVETGAIAALANIHRLDNGKIGEYFNYSIDYSYEPGAVAQTMTLAAALSDRVVESLDENIPTNHGRLEVVPFPPDKYIINYERKNLTDSISVLDGFVNSSTYVASYISTRYADSQKYYDKWYDAFCVDCFEIDDIRDVYMPALENRSLGTLASMGAGYGFKVCPMHILTFYNTVANSGEMMRPMLVKSMMSKKYGTQFMTPYTLNAHVLRPEVASSLRMALRENVRKGTGRILHDMPHEIAGKTGVSRLVIDPHLRGDSANPYCDSEGRFQYAATFAGFYPVCEPKYSVVCALFTKPTHEPLYGAALPENTVKDFISHIEKVR